MPEGDDVAGEGPPPPLVHMPAFAICEAAREPGLRVVAEEVPVALVYDGSTHAVMMATPADLEDFGVGFSLTEGVIERPGDLVDLAVTGDAERGCEVRMWLGAGLGSRHRARRRALAGPVGCGLCGVESLEEALRPPPRVESRLRIQAGAVLPALADLVAAQRLNREARAVHAAGFWTPEGGLRAAREDVGRHNALDKLAGALARAGGDGGAGIVLLTSRVSVEMVQKTARIGAPILVAVSAPTALAVRTAQACGLTLVASAREGRFDVFTHPERLRP